VRCAGFIRPIGWPGRAQRDARSGEMRGAGTSVVCPRSRPLGVRGLPTPRSLTAMRVRGLPTPCSHPATGAQDHQALRLSYSRVRESAGSAQVHSAIHVDPTDPDQRVAWSRRSACCRQLLFVAKITQRVDREYASACTPVHMSVMAGLPGCGDLFRQHLHRTPGSRCKSQFAETLSALSKVM
jgi:hypothetical protein